MCPKSLNSIKKPGSIIHWCKHIAKKHAENDFEKDFLKLMNNARFKKAIENVKI